MNTMFRQQIERLGGVRAVAAQLNVQPSTVHRWLTPTDGLEPECPRKHRAAFAALLADGGDAPQAPTTGKVVVMVCDGPEAAAALAAALAKTGLTSHVLAAP